MTLLELLVVVAIVALLAVTVSPLLHRSSAKRRITTAADLVTTHLNGAAAKAIGSRDGGGVWFETDDSGSGSDLAVALLGLARPRVATSGSAQITNVSASSATIDITWPNPFPPHLSPFMPGATIAFQGIPVRYQVGSITGNTAIITMPPNFSSENASFPALGSATPPPPASPALPFSLDLPPRRKPSASAPLLSGDTCIDFYASTIGVHGFSPSTNVVPLSGFKILCITFDGVGRATTAWVALNHSAATSSSWRRIALTPATPIALLIGTRSQIGERVVTQRTVESPGPNFQSPDAVWVIVDPRTSVIRTVANIGAPDPITAQTPIAEALSNQPRTF